MATKKAAKSAPKKTSKVKAPPAPEAAAPVPGPEFVPSDVPASDVPAQFQNAHLPIQPRPEKMASEE